jgi:hypothetical protein
MMPSAPKHLKLLFKNNILASGLLVGVMYEQKLHLKHAL